MYILSKRKENKNQYIFFYLFIVRPVNQIKPYKLKKKNKKQKASV